MKTKSSLSSSPSVRSRRTPKPTGKVVALLVEEHEKQMREKVRERENLLPRKKGRKAALAVGGNEEEPTSNCEGEGNMEVVMEIRVREEMEEEQPEEVGAEEVGSIEVRAFAVLIYCMCPLLLILIFLLL